MPRKGPNWFRLRVPISIASSINGRAIIDVIKVSLYKHTQTKTFKHNRELVVNRIFKPIGTNYGAHLYFRFEMCRFDWSGRTLAFQHQKLITENNQPRVEENAL